MKNRTVFIAANFTTNEITQESKALQIRRSLTEGADMDGTLTDSDTLYPGIQSTSPVSASATTGSVRRTEGGVLAVTKIS